MWVQINPYQVILIKVLAMCGSRKALVVAQVGRCPLKRIWVTLQSNEHNISISSKVRCSPQCSTIGLQGLFDLVAPDVSKHVIVKVVISQEFLSRVT